MPYSIEVMSLIDVRYLEVDVEPRYWEDATIDGVQDVDGTIPKRDGDVWKVVIDLDKERVLCWPKVEAHVQYKVCDAGTYTLLDECLDPVVKISGYVPSMLGGGDYLDLRIDRDGRIKDLRVDLREFEEHE